MHHYTKLSSLPPAATNCQGYLDWEQGLGIPSASMPEHWLVLCRQPQLLMFMCAAILSCPVDAHSGASPPLASIVFLLLWAHFQTMYVGCFGWTRVYVHSISNPQDPTSSRYVLSSRFKHKNAHPTSSCKPSIVATFTVPRALLF